MQEETRRKNKEGEGDRENRKSPLDEMDQEHAAEGNVPQGHTDAAELTRTRLKQQVLGENSWEVCSLAYRDID